MTVDLLADLAASIPVPVDAFGPVRAYVEVVRDGPDHAATAPCAHRYGYRLYFALDGGRRRSGPVGPSFTQPGQAVRLAKLLNADSVAGGRSGSPEPSSSRSCSACQGPLPARSRPHRRTCSGVCRQRLAREARAASQGARGSKARGARSVTPPNGWAGPAPVDLPPVPNNRIAAASVGVAAAGSEVRRDFATPTT